MGDRTDIDALLIGALYGELTPADEARLAAHLESHPADRTALADLSRIRDAVRSSRVLSVQAEPPQSVSALLIQEAARRMPRVEREPGWLYRITRVLLAHPAIAVAAMFVIVLGVAGTMRMRRGEQFAEPAAPAATSTADTAAAPATLPAANEIASRDSAGSPEPSRVMTPVVVGAPPQEPSAEPTGASETSAGSAAQPAASVPEADRARAADTFARPPVATDGAGEAKRQREQDAAALAALDRDEPETADRGRAQKPSPKQAGIVLRRPEPMPKDLEERAKTDSKNAVLSAESRSARGPVAEAGGAAAPPPTAGAPAAAPPATPARSVRSGAGASADDETESLAKAKLPARQVSGAKIAQDATVAPPAAAPPPPPPAPEPQAQREDRRFAEKPGAPAESKAEDKAGDKPDRSGEDRALLGWARKQHEQVLAAVKSSRCDEAASLATEIYRRAPAFYAENLATARTMKPCASYLNREREREDRNRAASKRAYSNEAPAPAPAPTKK